jgi:hypothetical protein
MRLIRWLGIIVVAIIVAFGALLLAARFSDGPVGMVAGGPLVAGELVTGPDPDWTFPHELPTIQLQLLDHRARVRLGSSN